MSDAPKKMQASVFHSAKARVFLALGLIVIVIVAVGLFIHWRSQVALNAATASVTGAPGIASTPGGGNPSDAYVAAQNKANEAGEAQARKNATAFVPTITRAGFVGNPDEFGSTGMHCPTKNVVVTYKPDPESCTPTNLDRARQAGVTAEELTCQGCSCPALRTAGYTAGDLKKMGMTVDQLKTCGFDLKDLIDAGFDASDLAKAGFTAAQLKAAGFTPAELKAAGFTPAELQAAGISSTDKPTSPNCSPEKLKQEREDGVSAVALRAQGCGVDALKSAGFSAAALKAAGFTAAQLKDAGYSAKALKDAGFSAADLKKAGFSAGQLVAAGYSPKELKDAGFTAGELRRAGVSAAALKAAGFSANALKAAGFTKGDLLRAGFSPAALGEAPVKPAAASTDATQPVDDLSGTAMASDQAILPGIGSNSREARLAQFEKQEQADMTQQQRRDHVQRLESYMVSQAQTLMGGWGDVAPQQLVKAPEEKKNVLENAASNVAGVTGAPAAGTTGVASTGAPSGPTGPVIKAGSVLFAVIDTSINSDENTPILARIITGDLNGSTLLGSFTREHDNVFITFKTLSSPQYPTSIPINAVAIDQDTARTAVSGQVNHHYMLRYGSMFAAAFVQGVSQGIINQGVTSNCLFGGFGCTLQQTALSSRQQVLMGLGQMGQAYSQNMGKNFNLAPTIRISAGTGIGLLIMSDLTLPVAPLSQPAATAMQSSDMRGL